MTKPRTLPAPQSFNNPQAHPRYRLWFRLLLIAPGRLVALNSPLSPDEVLRRLQANRPIARVLDAFHAELRLPVQNNQRRFFLWIEPLPDGGTRLNGQMQTPYRVALIRLACAGALTFVGLFWFMAARFWLGGFFLVFALFFVLLSQYERVIGRGLREHRAWVEKNLDAR